MPDLNANQAAQASAWQAEKDRGAQRVRDLQARPWWTCTACNEQFRWDKEHHCKLAIEAREIG